MVQTRALQPLEVDRFRGGKVWRYLEGISAIDLDKLRVLELGTRDQENETVLLDTSSGLIFLPDSSFRAEQYFSDSARSGEEKGWRTEERINSNTARRISQFRPFLMGKRVLDFGCGRGSFLRSAAKLAEFVAGVEPVPALRLALNEEGFVCEKRLDDIYEKGLAAPGLFDTVTMFHVLEHLEEPLKALRAVRQSLSPGGYLVVEVPHANSLLSELSEEFLQFSLWSQHLVLHTRTSLEKTLRSAGFSAVRIAGIQRYPLSNFLHWLAFGEAGGHLGSLSILDDFNLSDAWEHSLSKTDATDTLVAVGRA